MHYGTDADVAQLVEQLIRNEQVTGSIPAIGSISNKQTFRSVYYLLSGLAGANRTLNPNPKVASLTASFYAECLH